MENVRKTKLLSFYCLSSSYFCHKIKAVQLMNFVFNFISFEHDTTLGTTLKLI